MVYNVGKNKLVRKYPLLSTQIFSLRHKIRSLRHRPMWYQKSWYQKSWY